MSESNSDTKRTVCGHERDVLIEALDIADMDDPLLQHMCLMAPGCLEERQVLRDACGAVLDPAKLASIAENLTSHVGWAAYPFLSYMQDGITIFSPTGTDGGTVINMPSARAFVLALLDAPEATAQDVERMIGELK